MPSEDIHTAPAPSKPPPPAVNHPQFPDVEEESGDKKHVTRREQIGKKKDVKKTRGHNGKVDDDDLPGESEESGKMTAAKSKLRRARHLDEEAELVEGGLEKKQRLSEEEEVPASQHRPEPPEVEQPAQVKRKRKDRTEPSSGSAAVPKAKAKAKAKSKAAGKPKAKAGAKAKAQTQTESKAEKAAGKATAKAKAKAKAKAQAKGKGKGKARGRGKRAAEVSGEDGEHEGPAMPEPETFPDLEDMRAEVTKEVLTCLKTCDQAGELQAKGKHNHQLPEVCAENLQLSVYWSRNSVGLKKWDTKAKKWNQCVYFSRDSPCCGTNLVLAKHWVP